MRKAAAHRMAASRHHYGLPKSALFRMNESTPSSAVGTQSSESAEREMTMGDVFAIIRRRRVAFAIVFVIIILTGGLATAWATPQYTATVEIIPLQQEALIKGWLNSRQAATWVTDTLDNRLETVLGADASNVAERLQKRVDVRTAVDARTREVVIKLTVTLPHDPGLTSEVAHAYLMSLHPLRPQLERVTASTAYERYYDGTNEEAALQKAENFARMQEYWVIFDPPAIPRAPSKPDVALNATLTVFAASAGGVAAAFAAEAFARSRRDSRGESPVPATGASNAIMPMKDIHRTR